MIDRKYLYVIPARGGSKGIPLKNIKILNGKPLICYSIDIARQLTDDKNICVSTDDEKIIQVVKNYGLNIPFVRPNNLAGDTSTTNDVLLHALSYYENNIIYYDAIVLLQPTSPLRSVENVIDAINLYSSDLDMVVSVKESDVAPVLCEGNNNGYLEMTLNKDDVRRQDVRTYYEYNGAVYVINPMSLKEKGLSQFTKIKKVVMENINSIDIDIPFDWALAEFLLKKDNKSCI